MTDRKDPMRRYSFILVSILGASVLLSGGAYIGIHLYQKAEEQRKDIMRITQEKEKEALNIKTRAEAQQIALEQAQAEIEKLKQESNLTQEKQLQLEQKINTGKQSTGVMISSTELAPYLSAVVKISCSSQVEKSTGSGTFWRFDDKYGVLTNDHVPLRSASYCTVSWPYDEAKGQIRGDHFLFFPSFDLDWNKETDATFIEIDLSHKSGDGVSIASMNYGLYKLRKCPQKMAIGAPVMIIGYPASTQTETTYPRTISNGIISGYDQSVQPPQGVLPSVNYFVSNKIDSGNSGGMSISKDSSGLCILGIPTWLRVGNYDTQGIIQSIHNILYEQ